LERSLSQSVNEPIEGEVFHPQVTQRYFVTLEAMADFIRTFAITNGAFAHGNYANVGPSYLLEYPRLEQ
jgi:hypothetical protein